MSDHLRELEYETTKDGKKVISLSNFKTKEEKADLIGAIQMDDGALKKAIAADKAKANDLRENILKVKGDMSELASKQVQVRTY